MDLQSFIQSGLLESYIANQCSPAERELVERMLEQYPEARKELDKIEQALEQFAQAHAVTPPAGLRNKILEQLDAPAAPTTAQPANYLRVFQLVSIVLTCLAAYLIWLNRQQAAALEQVKKDMQTTQIALNDCLQRRQHTESMVALLRDTDTRAVALTDGKSLHLTIFHNKVRQACALDVSGVPVPRDGKYFQAWAIVEGKPVDLGMVQMNAIAGWQPLPYQEKAVAYAISEESNPRGNPTPTIVIAVGNVEG